MTLNRIARRISRYVLVPFATLSIAIGGMTSVAASDRHLPAPQSQTGHDPSVTSLAQAPPGLQKSVRHSVGSDGASLALIQNEKQKLIPGDGEWGAYFGHSVSISGSYAVIGALAADGPNGELLYGAAYIFVRSASGTWSKQAELVRAGGVGGDEFGTSVAISGDYAVVGARDAHGFNGAAYVFVRSGSTWTQQQELAPSVNDYMDAFGTSVAISGSYAVVGAERQGCAGKAYVFHRTGNTWLQEQQLSPPGGDCPGWGFGHSVAIDGDYVAVGNPAKTQLIGAVYVYYRQGNTWPQQGSALAGSNVTAGGLFGSSVALDASNLLVGAPGYQSNAGEAVVFSRSGTSWPEQTILSSNGAANDKFGDAVALRGDHLVVGAPGVNSITGAAYVFRHIGTGYPQYAELLATDGVSGAVIGTSVAVEFESGQVTETAVLVGAPAGFNYAGAPSTYVYGLHAKSIRPCYSNIDPIFDSGVGITSANYVDDPGYNTQGAANFILTKRCKFWKVATTGIYYNGSGPASSVNVIFWKDKNGKTARS